MKSWSIKRKLAFLCSSLLIMIVLVGGIGMALNIMAMRQIDFADNVHIPAVRSMGLADMYHDGLRAIVLRAITAADDKERAEVAQELAEMTKSLSEQFEILHKLNIAPEIKAKIENETKPAVEAYAKASEEIAALALGGNKDRATARMPDFQAAFKKLEGELEKLGETLTEGTAAEKAAADRQKSLFSLGGLLVMALGLFFGTILSVLIVKELLTTLNRAINQLSTSNSELLSASAQTTEVATNLSQSVSEQASSVQETMASVEEITAMVTQNSESANRVKLAVDANEEASNEGSMNVDEMLSAIDQIKVTNENIVAQMMSSNKEFAEIVRIISEIGEKTKVINDIVFQTKLLSFNASVEAARAGEHGKGFAVVAEEVGNLAQMSGNAAKEISDMLGNSINKVNSIVTETTQRVDQLVKTGTEKVMLGQTTAEKCREALRKIYDNAKSISTMVVEITTASKEQTEGIQEINKAISQIDQTTQQNSNIAEQSSTQAAQLSSEATNISEIVNTLVQLVHGKNNHAHMPQPNQPPQAPRILQKAAPKNNSKFEKAA